MALIDFLVSVVFYLNQYRLRVVKKMIKCTDCYELNEETRSRCVRCGRLLEPVSYGSKNSQQSNGRHKSASDLESAGKFEVQHEDAPNVMRTDRSIYRR